MQNPNARVLILAGDPVIAALLGMLLELDGYDPLFPERGDAVEQALSRRRGPIVVCADCERDDIRSDLFHARISRSGARLVLFGGARSAESVRELAGRRAAPYFLLPTDRATLARVLGGALEEPQASPSRKR